MMSSSLEVHPLTLGPLQSNCYVLRAPGAERAAVVDPGAEPERIRSVLAAWDAALEAILLTHAHLDHVGAVAALKQASDAGVFLHPADRELYDAAPRQAESFGLSMDRLPAPDRALEAGQRLEVGGATLEVRHTPGHSPGGVTFVHPGHAFVGDCVFAGSVGRVDLPGGDAETLLASIRSEILSLDDETVLWPGHGPRTTVGREASSNPFLTGAFGWSG